ncbi:hypothetical protein [Streptomyces sp. SM10]|uniref:hypothetical protein n=1 Tax=Streptomyces sp. SM10 TaxID=565556 RepID=UPI0015E1667C|nr:hypothetical protein [Streptomyces sp. SM10]
MDFRNLAVAGALSADVHERQADARAEEALREALDDLPRTPLLHGFVPHARMEG